MGKLINKKLSGETLIGSIIAMFLMALCFAIGLSVYITVVQSNRHQENVTARFLAKKISNESLMMGNFRSEELHQGEYIIKKSLQLYKENGDLKVLTISVHTANGKQLTSRKELIVIPQD